MVLDIGCGNGRNSIYLASRGCEVDCFDVVNLNWQKELPIDIKSKIDFKKSSILEYSYKPSQYDSIIISRVIQYLNTEELNFLLEKVKYSIQPDGFLLLSYNTKGGIFNKEEIHVSKYSHGIEEIEKMLNTIFKKVVVSEGSKRSQHVNYEDDIVSFDIFATDLRGL